MRSPAPAAAVAAAVALALLFASVVPVPAATPSAGPADAVGFTTWLHAVGYALLAVALVRTRAFRSNPRSLLAAALVATCYGASVEVVQATLPYRTASLVDAGVNAGGAALGVAATRALAAAQSVASATSAFNRSK